MGYSPWGCKEWDTTWLLSSATAICIGLDTSLTSVSLHFDRFCKAHDKDTLVLLPILLSKGSLITWTLDYEGFTDHISKIQTSHFRGEALLAREMNWCCNRTSDRGGDETEALWLLTRCIFTFTEALPLPAKGWVHPSSSVNCLLITYMCLALHQGPYDLQCIIRHICILPDAQEPSREKHSHQIFG